MTNTDRRAGWDRIPGTCTISNGKGKIYRNMVRFERPCANCGERFGIHVTQSTADGEAHNSSFGLRNCEKHRMKMVAPGIGVSFDEAERLKTANATMKEELTGLYARNAALHAENQVLKAKLAPYELAGMEVARTTALTMETETDKQSATTEMLRRQFLDKQKTKAPQTAADLELGRQWLAKNNSKMPWQEG